MDFIIRDLLISVVPLGRMLEEGGRTCTTMTNCPGGCTGVTPHPTGEPYEEVINPVNIALLKLQLKESLAAVEEREKVIHEALKPKSIGEVEILQAQLEAALEALKETAEEIEQRPSATE